MGRALHAWLVTVAACVACTPLAGADAESVSDGQGDQDTAAVDGTSESESGDSSPCSDQPGTRLVAGGSFTDGDGGAHDIPALCFDRREVSVGEYRACVDAGGCTEPTAEASHATTPAFNWGAPQREEHPVNGVEYRDAADYCAWTERRVPTQWEWEWAARGRDEAREFPWGTSPPTCEFAIMDEGDPAGCGASGTWASGSRSPAGDSRDGLEDMAGNVLEWTYGRLDGPPDRVVRGGGWTDIEPEFFRTSALYVASAETRAVDIGFRCVVEP